MSTIAYSTAFEAASSASSLRSLRWKRRLRLTGLLLILALVSLAEPNVFRFVLRQVISFEAWRSGVSVYIGRIQGSLFEPIALINSHWTYRSDTGATTRLEIARTDAQFAWRDFFKQSGDRWFRRLSVRGVRGKIVLPGEPQKRRGRSWAEQLRPRGRWLAVPGRIEAREVDFVFQSGQDYVRLEQTRFRASELEPGILRASRITVRQRGFDRTFHEVRGTTALKNSELFIANLVLEPDVEIRNLSAGFVDLARGELNVDLTVAAFGGTVRVVAKTLPRERVLTFDAVCELAQINIARLAAFFGVSEAAAGTIKEGRFTFRGAPHDVVRAAASARLNASNFRWGSRQWDSLTLGARLMDRRIHVMELELQQAHNRLSLAGEFGIPPPGAKWWQHDLTCEIAAKLENLTDLSELLLPEFKYIVGKAGIDGSIRIRNEQFHGQLILSGSALKWRDAPIENLHAAIKLQGNECQVSNFDLFNAGDYIRGSGVVNIRGPTQYWGEFHASIDELGSYAALLQPPIVPEPLAGGAIIDWSGEGSAKGHSGQLLARLKKIRSLGSHVSQLHPINADLEAHYAPGTVQFSRFSLSDDDSSFTAAVAVGPKTFSVQNIRLMHQQQLWLEGSALLPLDVWNAWPNTSLLTLLNDATVSRVNLSAYDLELGAASQLLGWKFPIGGKVRGNIVADGPIGSLNLNGKVSLTGGQLPFGGNAGTFTEMETGVTLRGSTIALEQFVARHRNGYLRLSGTVGLENVRDPRLQLALESRHMGFRFFQVPGLSTSTRGSSAAKGAIDVGSALDLTIEGPLSAASVQGRARISDLVAGSSPLDLTPLWQDPSPSLPPALIFAPGPWKAWRLDVRCRTEPSVALLPGTVTADLQLTGTGASPVLAGSIQVAGVPASAGDNPLMIQDATVTFHEDRPEKPTLDLRASGSAFDSPFMAFATGPLSHLMRWFIFEPPLSERLIRQALTESETSHLQSGARFSLLAPAAVSENVQTYNWSAIEMPAPAEKNDRSTVELETTTASAQFP